MENLFVLLGVFGWIALGYLWLAPQKKRLLAEFGYDKDYYFFRKLANDGHPASKRLIRETWMYFGIGVIGGLVMVLTK